MANHMPRFGGRNGLVAKQRLLTVFASIRGHHNRTLACQWPEAVSGSNTAASSVGAPHFTGFLAACAEAPRRSGKERFGTVLLPLIRRDAGITMLPPMPTIDGVLDAFLQEQQARLSERTFRDYETVISLLRDSLNTYGHASLVGDELQRFEQAFGDGSTDEQMRAFCRTFGPEKIAEHYYEFLSWFLIRKVMASEDLRRKASTVTMKLATWLADGGYVDPHIAEDAAEMAADAGRLLPRAERLGEILYRVMEASPPLWGELSDQDFYENMASISRIEPGKLWFDDVGPIDVPEEASKIAEVGWEVNVVLGRGPSGWQILELGNVYPM